MKSKAGVFVLSWALMALAVGAVPERAKAPRKAAAATELNEAEIAQLTADMLANWQYTRRPFDKEISTRFFDSYVEMLDHSHLFLLKSDLNEFENYRTNLNVLTLEKHDVSPCRVIFDRFMERVDQHLNYVTNVLATEAFEFTGHDRFVPQRNTLAPPKDLPQAKEIWRQELRYEYLQEKLQQTNQAEIYKTLTNRYTRVVRNYKELTHENVFEMYVTSLAHAYDPHSDYMGAAHADNFAIQMSLSLCGIGATLTSVDGYSKVHDLMPGGPAIQSGKLKINDRIVAVAQSNQEPVDVVGLPLSKVVGMIRGPKGTKVGLTVIPANAADGSTRQVITLVRDELKLEAQAAKARVYDTGGSDGAASRLGVVQLPSFYGNMGGSDRNSTTADVARLLQRLKKEHVEGVILDLRHNGGGLVDEVVRLSGLFIPKGPILQTKDPSGRIAIDADTDPSVLYDGPLVVLVDRFSASASEILAGAMQDYQRALIVGDRATFGKGTVQSVVKLAPWLDQKHVHYKEDPGSLKLTVKKFYRAGGSSTQNRGVAADVELPSVLNWADVGERSLPNALAWDETTGAGPLNLNRTQRYLAEIRQRSADRIARDPDWAQVNEDIKEYQQKQADKSVSLNEKERRTEKNLKEARAEARKKEHLARKKSDEKVYEITLKNVDLAELRPPPAATNAMAAATTPRSAELDEEDMAQGDTPEPEDPALTDTTLNEARRILADYVALLKRPAVLSKVD